VPLAYFEQQSMQMGMNPTQALNVNQMLVGPTLMNTTVIMLFLFPADHDAHLLRGKAARARSSCC
jgi:hypothetical protein